MRELTMDLNPRAKTPLYEQIYAYIKGEIQTGQIKAREKLPSSRSLAAYLEVSRSTVDLAYEQLLSEGYLESVPCKGYYACQIEDLYRLTPAGEKQESFREEKADEYDYDFTPSGIDLESFPFDLWRRLTRTTLMDGNNKELFQLGEPKGEWELRETISHYLRQARGVSCSPDQLILGAGNDYLLLFLSVLLGMDHKIAMETPTYQHASRIFEQLGYALVQVPMDAQGMKTDELARSGADIAYVMPSHQYPMGIVMPIKRRLELLAWAAEKEGRYLIEDDYDSEFRYKGKPVPALQGSDSGGKVIYLGTFSRSIAPAIRISYLVLPETLLAVCGERIGSFSSTVSRIDQMTLNTFMKEGYYERHLNKMRALYSKKHEVLLGELRRFGAEFRVSGEHAGVHLLLEVRNGRSREELILRAKEQRVRVYPLPGALDGTAPTLILGYATLSEREIKEACARLRKAWK